MTLITADELARGVLLITFGSAAGGAALAVPGSPLWLVPAAVGVAASAFTVPEVREEVRRALPMLGGPEWNAYKALPLREKARYLVSGESAVEMLNGEPRRSAPTSAPAQRYGVEFDEGTEYERPAPARAAAASRPAPTAERPRWLQALNDDADRAPHALILGPSGAGKTTLATAVMDDRGGRVVVLSPKVSAGSWSGAEVVTLDDDGSYAPLEAALADLEEEKRARIVRLRNEGRDALEPLTIVFDELQDFTGQVPEAGAFMVNLSSIGREIKMRLIGVGTTDEALNIRGWKASRRNYLRVEMNRDRRAVMNDGVREITVTPTDSQQRAARARLRPWRGEAQPEPPTPTAAPSTGTTQLVRREATIDMADLARVAPSLATKRGYTPTPQDTAALADLMATMPDDAPAQSVTVERGGSGDVIVNVQQTRSRSQGVRRRTTLDAQARRARADKYRVVLETVRAQPDIGLNELRRQLGGDRNRLSEYWNRARRELGIEK